jgi:hypothetical protein
MSRLPTPSSSMISDGIRFQNSLTVRDIDLRFDMGVVFEKA